MVMTARALDARRPQPSATGGMVRVADGVIFSEAENGSGAVFLWGTAAWFWAAGDRAARRLAAVQLVETKAARQRQVATAFGVNEDSLILWRGEYSANGATALAGRRPGPKGPSKLTEAKRVEIGALRAEGLTLIAVAQRAGVSIDTVRRALARTSAPVRVAPPADDQGEPQGARTGPILEPPAIPAGRSVPLAGALVVLPALVATGLLDAVPRVDGREGVGRSGLRALVAMVLACLLEARSDPGSSRVDPADISRLLGFAGAVETEPRSWWMRELAAPGRTASLVDALARRRLHRRLDVEGILDVAGAVRAYRRGAELGGSGLARARLSTATDLDTRVFDRRGDGVLVWNPTPDGAGLDRLRAVAGEVRDVVGPDARPTVWFDRAGWPPKLFAELTAAGFEVLAYGKSLARAEPRQAFQGRRFVDPCGRACDYLVAESDVGIEYDGGRRRFRCRRITSLDPRTGHQTQIVASRRDLDAATIIHATFQRGAQEDFVEFMTRPPGRDAGGERFPDVVRMAAYNAASVLARRLASEHDGDTTRALLDATLRSPGDLQIVGQDLHVRLAPLSAPRSPRAVAALGAELTATRTRYPGTDLTLVYVMADEQS
jgi:transposase-like protein